MLFSVWHGPVVWCGGEVYRPGMVPGTGIRVGVPEGYTGYPAAKDVPLLSGGLTAKRAPEGPSRGPGVGGQPAAPRDVRTHPPGPVGTLWAPPWCSSSKPRLSANKDKIQ